MKRKLLLTVVSIVIIACVSSLLIVNPGWKAKETIYNSHYVIQVGPSNGTIGPMNLNSGDILSVSTTITSGKATFLIEQQTVNPSLMTDWKRIIYNGTGSWRETLTVPANNKYLFAFLLNDNFTSASINAACIREYTQHIIP
jgi:hypothetical protein